MGTPKTETVGTRLEPEVVERLDKIATRLTAQSPIAVEVKRAEVLRALVLRALPGMERELGMLEAAGRAAAALGKVSEDVRAIVREDGAKPVKKTAKKTAKRAKGAK